MYKETCPTCNDTQKVTEGEFDEIEEVDCVECIDLEEADMSGATEGDR